MYITREAVVAYYDDHEFELKCHKLFLVFVIVSAEKDAMLQKLGQ